MAEYFEHGDGFLDTTKCEKFHDHLSDSHSLKVRSKPLN